MDSHAADAAPAALNDLIAAGLVSHEVIGDPGRLGAEAETLRTLCGLVAGPVWRVGPFHYAFRAQAGDLGGTLAETAPEGWSAALETALQTALGPDAIWVSPADILAAQPAIDLEAPLLLLRAQAAAVAGALAEGPEAPPAPLQAVISARYAAEVARLTAEAVLGAAPGKALEGRLAAIEAGLAALAAATPDLAAIEATLEATAGTTIAATIEAAAGAIAERVIGEISRRLDAQAATIEGLGEALGERIAGIAAGPGRGPELDDFRESVGLALAEFLARIETSAPLH